MPGVCGAQRAAHRKTQAPKHTNLGTPRRRAVAAATTEAEAAELRALAAVGRSKQRRWMNDKLLRAMVGALTAREMEQLFKPVPFGREPVPSAFALAAQPEHEPLWALFRSVDMDKQERVFAKW